MEYSSIIFVILLASTYGLPTDVTTTDAPETTTQKVFLMTSLTFAF